MLVVTKKVNDAPQIAHIEDFKAMQEFVGGYVESVTLSVGVTMLCNEEGKLDGLPPNFIMGTDTIVGDVLFIGHTSDGDFRSLTNKEISIVIAMFLI